MVEIKQLLDTILSINQINILNAINPTINTRFISSQNFYSRLEEKYNGIEIKEPNQYLSKEILNKFLQLHQKEIEISDFKIREIRILTFNLNSDINNNLGSILTNNDLYDTFIKLIKAKWLDSFNVGLYISAIRSWELENTTKLLKFIQTKIKDYDGRAKRYLRIKNNIHYFLNEKGLDKLISEVISDSIPLNQISQKLEISQDLLTSTYFSFFINKFYNTLQNKKLLSIDKIDEFEEFLDHHNNNLTNKILIPKMIYNNQNVDIKLFDRIRDLTFDQIGDPANEYKWSPDTRMSKEEVIILTDAKEILNRWLIQKFINVFFEICINDPDRKKYWLQYVDRINTFRVYGTSETKRLLKLDDRIKDFISSRFIMVDGNGNKSAFLIEINDYSLIEFGDSSNAFYAYKKNSTYRQVIDSKINKLEELKYPSLPSLHSFPLEENGKLHHRGDWQRNFTDFLRRKVL